MSTPLLHSTDLFTARTAGYWNYRIPGLTVTPGGVVLAHTEARQGQGGDGDPIDILLRRSADGGRSWERARCVVDHTDYPGGPINNFVCIPDRDTRQVHALFCTDYARAFHLTSEEDGLTWSAPVGITQAFEAFRREYDWHVLAVGPGHGIQLDCGRLLAPVWLSTGAGTEFGSGKRGHCPNRAGVVFSDDHGRTWQRGDLIRDTFPNTNETEAVQLADGRVLRNMRPLDDGADHPDAEHRRAVSLSADGAHNWSTPYRDPALLEPVCFASLCRHSRQPEDAENIVLFANPDNLEKTMTTWARDRKNLTVKASFDECRTWSVSRVLEPGPSGYSDLAVLSDKTILCFYECGMIDHMADSAALTLARFSLEWVEQGAPAV